jgi:2-desacetyl-2-hydroxyethyl bacteriochlorophyllide A dehydrogenase
MKSIVLNEPGSFSITEVPPPLPPGVDEVQIRIRQVGICGTDLHAYKGEQPFFNYPRILGHELAAEVVAVGASEQAHNLQPGDKCCVRPYLNCGTCSACLRGFTNCCEKMQVLGVHRDGGMREIINVPIDKVHKANLRDDELALVEMLSIGAHAVHRARVTADDYVVVIGVGPIGLGVCLFAQETGARVVAIDLSDQRLGFAKQYLGIKDVINGKDQPLEQLKQIMPNELPTVVFDATGSLRSMAQSITYAGHGARVVFVGLARGDISFDDPEFHRRELTLMASRNATADDFGRVIKLLESGRVDITPWVTHRAEPEQMLVEFADWTKPDSSVVKAVLSFSPAK